jgi:alpha-acetolactate decarboxylase
MRAPLLASWLLVLGSCARWDGTVERHGTMREVMREGKSGPRISLDAAMRSSRTVAIGALEGLDGEIAIVDGETWISRGRGAKVVSEPVLNSGLSAALLASADVPSWRSTDVEREVSGLDDFLASVAAPCGLEPYSAWPFVIQGEFLDLEAHVLRGACPSAGDVPDGKEPARRSFERVRGRLVGFYAPDSAGELTHHGTRSHVHVVIVGWDDPFVGHVDSVRIAPGATLRTPEPLER